MLEITYCTCNEIIKRLESNTLLFSYKRLSRDKTCNLQLVDSWSNVLIKFKCTVIAIQFTIILVCTGHIAHDHHMTKNDVIFSTKHLMSGPLKKLFSFTFIQVLIFHPRNTRILRKTKLTVSRGMHTLVLYYIITIKAPESFLDTKFWQFFLVDII